MKDPGQILDSFRTDISSRNIYTNLLRQFDLEYPARNGNRKKYRPSGGRKMNRTAAVLSLCLVTGLSFGVGSAFADSDVPPDTAPLDLPPGKAKVKLELPGGKSSEPEGPVHEGPPPDAGQAVPSVSVERKEPKRSSWKESAPSDQEPKRSSGKEPAPSDRETPPADVPKKRENRREPAASPGTGPVELPPLLDLPGELVGEQPPKSAGKDPGSPPKASSVRAGNRQVERATPAGTGRVSGTGGNVLTADAGTGGSAASGNAPRTVNGGELPQTASGDLDGVIAGGLAALLGSLYMLRRDGDETK